MDQDDALATYDEHHAKAVAPHFDARYYLASNPDVARAGANPLVHFLTIGWKEGRNPSAGFDVNYYLRTNPDVMKVGLNPLVHYVWAGQCEGRAPRRAMDALRRSLETARAASLRVPEWAAAADCSPPMSEPALISHLEAAGTACGLVISVSHDDYIKNSGGIQNVIRHEQLACERDGWLYLHLSPAAPLPMLAEAEPRDKFRFCVRLGSKKLGIVEATGLKSALCKVAAKGARLRFVLHQLMGHSTELIAELAALADAPLIFWCHDYFALCTDYTLMRNSVAFCEAPPVTSGSCTVCAFGADRPAHVRRIEDLFRATQPLVLVPSQTALDLWRLRSGMPSREAHVQPPARLLLAPSDPYIDDASFDRPLRIAHLGARIVSKGWNVFESIASDHVGDKRFTFYQLGGPHGLPLPRHICHIPVQVSRDHPDAMIDAVAESRIDVVVIWSMWPETFCFTAHEALAGGAFVLARKAAGNVAPALAREGPDQSCVLDDERSLSLLFRGEVLWELLRGSSRKRGVIIPEDGAAAWLSDVPPHKTDAQKEGDARSLPMAGGFTHVGG